LSESRKKEGRQEKKLQSLEWSARAQKGSTPGHTPPKEKVRPVPRPHKALRGEEAKETTTGKKKQWGRVHQKKATRDRCRPGVPEQEGGGLEGKELRKHWRTKDSSWDPKTARKKNLLATNKIHTVPIQS